MAQSKTTIELNGKLYDASTGAMLHNEAKLKAPTKNTPPNSNVTMDGFFRRPTSSPTTKPAPSQPQPVASRAHPAPRPASRKPERAQTLMRHVVKKPTTTPHGSPIAAAKPVQPTPAHIHTPATLLSERQARAAQVPKSSSVSRFSSNPRPTNITTKVAHLPVRPHPQAASELEPPIQSAVHHQPAHHQAHSSAETFNKALQNASSHTQPPLKHAKLRHRTAHKLGVSSRTVSLASGALVVILLTGFVAYQNVPNVSMRIAATKAGFHATLPGYAPGGFSMNGPIKSTPGAVTVSFRSHTDDRSYTVTQKASDWTSDSLRSNFFNASDSPTAYQDKGKTIYVYNNGASAAWVNGGVLYQVSGNAGLSTDQVVSIADSM